MVGNPPIKAKSSIAHMFEHLEGHMLRMMELRYGERHLADLRRVNAGKLEKEAIRLFHDASERHGGVAFGAMTVAEYCKAAIFDIENLSVSKIAPDIEGEDIEGVAFKLSDYRGKVVLLSFWGHW